MLIPRIWLNGYPGLFCVNVPGIEEAYASDPNLDPQSFPCARASIVSSDTAHPWPQYGSARYFTTDEAKPHYRFHSHASAVRYQRALLACLVYGMRKIYGTERV